MVRASLVIAIVATVVFLIWSIMHLETTLSWFVIVAFFSGWIIAILGTLVYRGEGWISPPAPRDHLEPPNRP